MNHTVAEFWHSIWCHKVEIIVMLSQMHEEYQVNIFLLLLHFFITFLFYFYYFYIFQQAVFYYAETEIVLFTFKGQNVQYCPDDIGEALHFGGYKVHLDSMQKLGTSIKKKNFTVTLNKNKVG